MTGKKRCVIDASILLDFIEGEIFETLFSLPLEFSTSDIVADEISRSYTPTELGEYGLEIIALEEEFILEIGTLQAEHTELSPNDLSVFILAREHGSFLISGDGPLRQLADISRIEYHGTLWLLEMMVHHEVILSGAAAVTLRTMLNKKRWLPRSDCEKLIRKWESEE
jgi:hypothetical protein